jgi:hypothetical protein
VDDGVEVPVAMTAGLVREIEMPFTFELDGALLWCLPLT